jgi:hypothetical protein
VEQVPAVGTGIGMQEMTNTTAAISPTSGRRGRPDSSFSRLIPIDERQRHHNQSRPGGNSEMCMAWAGAAKRNRDNRNFHKTSKPNRD